MATASFWDGVQWVPISGGGGGGGGGTGPQGPQGPPGLNGESVTVSGPQAAQPPSPRKGDIWLFEPPKTITTEPPVVTIGPIDPGKPPVLIIPGGGGGSFGGFDITNIQGSKADISTTTKEEDQ